MQLALIDAFILYHWTTILSLNHQRFSTRKIDYAGPGGFRTCDLCHSCKTREHVLYNCECCPQTRHLGHAVLFSKKKNVSLPCGCHHNPFFFCTKILPNLNRCDSMQSFWGLRWCNSRFIIYNAYTVHATTFSLLRSNAPDDKAAHPVAWAAPIPKQNFSPRVVDVVLQRGHLGRGQSRLAIMQ